MQINEPILDAAPDAMLVVDDRGHIVFANLQTEQVFGYPRSELVGQAVEALMPERFRHQHGFHRQAYVNDPHTRPMGLNMNLFGLRLDGSEFPVEVSLSPMTGDAGEMLVVAAIRDTTERRLVQRLSEESRLKDEFLATLSHELRTPLTAILGWSTLLGSRALGPAERVRAVESVIRSARQQARLIDDLLDVSRIVLGQLRVAVEPVDLRDIILAAIDVIKPAADAKGITLHTTLSTGIVTSGDPVRLQQVIWNLLSNAVKYTGKGGHVTIALERHVSLATLRVMDTGQGIDPVFLPHLFDRFRQADSSTTRPVGGLGIGLSIVRHLVDLHGGTVEARSEGVGHGSQFVVRLPLRPVSDVAPATHEGVMPPETDDDIRNLGIPDFRGLTILVVDDDPDTRQMIETLMRLAGAGVTTAASAADANAAIAIAPPQIIICDIGMPDEDGYSFLRRLRRSGVTIPAIALTAYARAEDRTRALLAGFQNHVAKPAEPAELYAVVAALVGRHDYGKESGASGNNGR